MLHAAVHRFNLLATVTAGLLATGCFQPGANTTFGQNQVRYDRFDFKILQTDHFDIYYYDEEHGAAEQAGRMAERWYARYSRLLNHQLRGRQVVIYYASHPHFKQTQLLGGSPSEGVGGATEPFRRRIVLPFAGPLKETDHVLGHELAHAFQFDMTGRGGRLTSRNFPRAIILPLWFIEGMAEYLSVGPVDPHTTMWIRDAATNDRLPTMKQLNDPRYFPYRFGQAFWAYVAGRWGDEVVGRILNAATRTGSAEAAFERVLSVPVDTINEEWHQEIQIAYADLDVDGKHPEDFATAVLSKETGEGRGAGFNFGPALSADGKEIVFISIRDLFSLDLFRANAETGEIQKKIVETASDPHFESLQFIKSAGSWDAESRRFAFGGITESDPVLTVIDAESGDILQERRFREIGEIFNPTWSPDGRRIAFSAITGGLSDLYMYDLETDSVRHLTDDPYADMHPAWSPDGRHIAFVTDRFSTDVARLDYGNYRLAWMDPETGKIDALPSFPGVKNTNPQWSPDSQNLYFISDRGGISNVYRLNLPMRQMYQITDLYTGVSGITALSPALTSATKTDKIAFSVYEKGEYNVYAVSEPEVLAGELVK